MSKEEKVTVWGKKLISDVFGIINGIKRLDGNTTVPIMRRESIKKNSLFNV